MLVSYLVYDVDTDELLDVVNLLPEDKIKFEKNNRNMYLLENEDFESDFTDEYIDDFDDNFIENEW